MTLREANNALKSQLSEIEDGDIEAGYILESATGFNRTQMLFNFESLISDGVFGKAMAMADRRLAGEPIQYILGEWDFMGFPFKVGKGVLIPRPETEILVEMILDKIKDIKEPVVYDLCSGSGCIGLSIKKLRNDARVFLVEKSAEALSYLKTNHSNLCKELENTTVIQGDILCLDSFFDLPLADVIVSNPPYIRSDEIKTLQGEVLEEPIMALDGGADGLVFYKALVNDWSAKLKENGFMAFECGEDQAQDICNLFEKINFNNETVNDYNNIPRLVVGRRK